MKLIQPEKSILEEEKFLEGKPKDIIGKFNQENNNILRNLGKDEDIQEKKASIEKNLNISDNLMKKNEIPEDQNLKLIKELDSALNKEKSEHKNSLRKYNSFIDEKIITISQKDKDIEKLKDDIAKLKKKIEAITLEKESIRIKLTLEKDKLMNDINKLQDDKKIIKKELTSVCEKNSLLMKQFDQTLSKLNKE